MSLDPLLVEIFEDQGRDPVVQHALVLDRRLLDVVERRGGILVVMMILSGSSVLKTCFALPS